MGPGDDAGLLPRAFLLTDVAGSTLLWEADTRRMAAALKKHDAIFADVVPRSGGRVIKARGEGDSLFCVFERAADAIEAAIACQQSLAAVTDSPLRVRMAVHEGLVTERDDDFYGPTVNRVARLRELAHGGQILVSDAVALHRAALPPEVSLLDLGVYVLRDIARPERVWQVVHPALDNEFPPLRGTAQRHNLPEHLTSFVGRGEDLDRVAEAVAAHRLVTLTGPGGVGKTRIAVEAARRLIASFSDGAWFVDLAGVAEDAGVAAAVVRAIAPRDPSARTAAEALADRFRDGRALLILDNCEHVRAAAARVASVALETCPGLRLVATSRERLRIPGERLVAVDSFPVPAAGADDDEIAASDVVRLFVDRASLVDQTFAPTPATRAEIADICRRVEGSPLAVELAAARIRVLSVQEIRARLEDRLHFLRDPEAAGRRQSLIATLDWSYDLLGNLERRCFERLSVFVSGFTLEAAQVVVPGDGIGADAVLDVVAGLVDKSLVRASRNDLGVRYRMLDVIREYARRALESSGTSATYDRLFAQWVLALARETRDCIGADQAETMARLRVEHENIVAGLALLDRDDLLEAVTSFAGFWDVAGFWREAEEALRRAIAAGGAAPMRHRARLELANVLENLGEYDEARTLAESVAREAVLEDDSAAAAYATKTLASLAVRQRLPEARSLVEDALRRARAAGEEHLVGASLHLLAGIVAPHDPATAEALMTEEFEIARRRFDVRAEAFALLGMAKLQRERRDWTAACETLRSALELVGRLGDRTAIGGCTFHLASTFAESGDRARAALLFEESLATSESIGDKEGVAFNLAALARLSAERGDRSAAEQRLRRAVALASDLESPRLFDAINAARDAFETASS